MYLLWGVCTHGAVSTSILDVIEYLQWPANQCGEGGAPANKRDRSVGEVFEVWHANYATNSGLQRVRATLRPTW